MAGRGQAATLSNVMHHARASRAPLVVGPLAVAALSTALLTAGCRNDLFEDRLDAGPVGEGEGEGEGDACDDVDVDAIAALHVFLTDTATSFPVCDATVIAEDGDFSDELVAVGAGAGCGYDGPFGRAGPYTLVLRKTGYEERRVPAAVVAGDCDAPVTRTLNLNLTPTP